MRSYTKNDENIYVERGKHRNVNVILCAKRFSEQDTAVSFSNAQIARSILTEGIK